MRKPKVTLLWRLLFIVIFFAGATPGNPQQHGSTFTATEAMIPMRDGVRLYTQVYVPDKTVEPLPFLLIRTPYGTGDLNPDRVARGLCSSIGATLIIVICGLIIVFLAAQY